MSQNSVVLSREDQEALAKKKKLTKRDYAQVYSAYYKPIFHFIKSRINHKEDAEDLTSLVFERVMKKLIDFQWQGVTITSWIYRIARNAIIDHYRRNGERKKDQSVEVIEGFLMSSSKKLDTLLIDDEEEVKLYNTIRELDEQDQFLIYYKFFEDLSNQQIAELTDLSETNVGTRLHRIRRKMKTKIDTKP